MTVTKEDLIKAYSVFGEITSCVIKSPSEQVPQNTKFPIKPTKFGFVNFKTKEDAREALQKARENEEIRSLYESSVKGTFDLYFHMKREQFSMFKESKKRSRRFYQSSNMMMTPQYPQYMMPPPSYTMDSRPHKFQNAPNMMDYYPPPFMMHPQQMNNMGVPSYRGPPNVMSSHNWNQNMHGGPNKFSNKPPGQNYFGNKPNNNQYKKRNFGDKYQDNKRTYQDKSTPQQNANIPASVSNQVNANFLKENLNEFLKFDREKQRTLLGEIIFPIIKKLSTEDLAPKITGMLIDFEVFEVSEILEFVDNEELLNERVQEAIELINQNTN